MDTIYFDFGGRSYSGYIMNAADKSYCWLVFNDDEMIEILGESVAFHINRNGVVPVYLYTGKAGMVESLRLKVEAVILQEQ